MESSNPAWVLPSPVPKEDISEILPGFLYLSGIGGVRFIEERGIRHVISVVRSYSFRDVKCGSCKFTRHMYDVDDDPEQDMLHVDPLPCGNVPIGHGDDCIPVVFQRTRGVYPDAHAFVEQRRPIISPNEGFITQLEGWWNLMK